MDNFLRVKVFLVDMTVCSATFFQSGVHQLAAKSYSLADRFQDWKYGNCWLSAGFVVWVVLCAIVSVWEDGVRILKYLKGNL
jgi:hypothetical protein